MEVEDAKKQIRQSTEEFDRVRRWSKRCCAWVPPGTCNVCPGGVVVRSVPVTEPLGSENIDRCRSATVTMSEQLRAHAIKNEPERFDIGNEPERFDIGNEPSHRRLDPCVHDHIEIHADPRPRGAMFDRMQQHHLPPNKHPVRRHGLSEIEQRVPQRVGVAKSGSSIIRPPSAANA